MAVRITPGTYDSLADEIAELAQRLQLSTVQVRSREDGGGSGVIWSADGVIITNAHVARRSHATVELADGRIFEAEVAARDRERDLAALRFEARDLPAAPVADSDDLRAGQLVLAVGNPLGLVGAVTLGIIHTVAPPQSRGRRRLVQADIRLAPGNSGGPLADAHGRVVGINSMIGGGLGLAVPSNAVLEFLRDGGIRPKLGVTTQPVLVPAAQGRIPGLLILEIEANSPAANGGLMLGDILIGADGRLFGDLGDLRETLQSAGPGGRIGLNLIRAGQAHKVDIILQPSNSSGPREEAA